MEKQTVEKQIFYVSIPLQRIAEQPHDHTYLFRIKATDVEVALLQEKIDQLADSELWPGILKPIHNEQDTNDRRHESEHLLKEVYEMIDRLEDRDVSDAERTAATRDGLRIPERTADDPTSAKHLGELLK